MIPETILDETYIQSENLDLQALRELCKSLANLDFVRRIYLLENRGDDQPTENPISLALEATEASDKQWELVLQTARDAKFDLGEAPYRLDELDSNARSEFIKSGKKIYDQASSPVSPT